MNLTIEPLSSEHIKEVAKISTLSFPKAERWDIFALKGELIKHISHSFVALNGDIVVGFLGMWIIAGEAQINTLAIDPNFRNQKIGTLLLNHIIEYCIKEKVTTISLEVRESNLAARKLYENKDFFVEGERKKYYSNNGETAILMRKNLE